MYFMKVETFMKAERSNILILLCDILIISPEVGPNGINQLNDGSLS